MDPAKTLRITREISEAAPQHRPRPDRVSIAVMVERYRDLDQSLQEFLFRQRRGTPDVLKGFMGVKEGGSIE
jgi:hypothetical protein